MLRTTYAILGVLALVLMAGFLIAPEGRLRDLSLGLGSAVIGILLTVLLVEEVLRRDHERERNRYRRIAMAQLRVPLLQHLQVFAKMYKASAKEKPSPLPTTAEALLGEGLTSAVPALDWSSKAPVFPEMTWFQYVDLEFRKFREALERTVAKYAVFLPSQTVDGIERLLGSHLMAFVPQAPRIPAMDKAQGWSRPYNLFGGQGMADLLHPYCQDLRDLVNDANENLDPSSVIELPPSDWRDDVAPALGAGRIKTDASAG